MLDAVSAVGLVSGVATLVDVVIEVFKCLSQYSIDVKSAPRRSEELRSGIDTLFHLIPKLRDAFETDINETKKGYLRSEIREFEAVLRELLERTKPQKVKGIQRLKWPFKEAENSRYISRIEGFKASFTLIMTIEQRYRSCPGHS
jgi:hypothetical protein